MKIKESNPSNTIEKPLRTAQIFHLLGTDCQKNIKIILEQTLSIIAGLFAIYLSRSNKKDRDVIHITPTLPSSLDTNSFLASSLFKDAFPFGSETLHSLSCIMPRDKEASDPLVQSLGIKACIGTPVFYKQKTLGTLWVIDTRPRSFTRDDIDCIQTLAAALGLEKARLAHENKSVRKLEKKISQAEKMELLGIIAGGVAHDLNNILSGLVSYPELLLMQLEEDSPLVEPISFIHDTGLKAADIVQDLLTLTRRGIPNTRVLNLNQVIHGYYNSSAHNRLERNFPEIYFKISSEPYLLNLNGSESHISKVVMNLVMNAAEAVQESGQVTIETFNRYVDISMGGDEIPEGEYVVLRVSDNGKGISQTDIKRIFEPFYTKKQMGRSGSGLGLSVVWNAVKDHQGYIKISSEKEKGTSFELYFPATRDKTENLLDNFKVEAFTGNKETVLVVDDVTGQRKIAQGCLKILGYIPFTVGSGEKAVAFLKKRSVDLLILDMKMEPGMDGLETYKEVLKINPKQKAIIASGFSETKRVKEAKQLGAGQYIKKPYTLQKFAIALKKELAENQQKSC
ncbi:MAG: response regulator [Desulfobacteraceae bacterium]|nr:response regulator [Desulfobacteraceae bacterium]